MEKRLLEIDGLKKLKLSLRESHTKDTPHAEALPAWNSGLI